MRLILTVAAAVGIAQSAALPPRELIAARVVRLTRESVWTPVQSVPMTFRTFHPQGLVKIGETLFVSSVEVRVPPKRGPQADARYDRDPGTGIGHLFKIDRAGKLLADLKLGEGAIYHPGGIDYDGTSIWVAVAEYRPNSRSIVYRVDPETLVASEVFRVADHIGAIVHNTDSDTLHGVSWGSRWFYRWRLGRDGKLVDAAIPLERLRTANPSHYVDYQDCKYLGGQRMLCTGVSEFRQASSAAAPFRLGGLDLVQLQSHRAVYQVPVPLWTAGGLDMTHNPSWFEPTRSGLRAYFLPEDDRSTLYVFEVISPEA